MKILDLVLIILCVFTVGLCRYKKWGPFRILTARKSISAPKNNDSAIYDFTTNKSFTAYDKRFEAHFKSIETSDLNKKLASLKSAFESEIVSPEVLYKCIYQEILYFVSLPTNTPSNAKNLNYLKELIQLWSLQAPEYINSKLINSLKEKTDQDNYYLHQLITLVESK